MNVIIEFDQDAAHLQNSKSILYTLCKPTTNGEMYINQEIKLNKLCKQLEL